MVKGKVISMYTKDDDFRNEYILYTIEELVPEDNLLRKVAKYVDFNFIYDLTKPYYSDKGRPAIDPVVLFKIPIIKCLMGISSIRRTCEEIHLNIAYRWFMNLPFSEKVPDHSTYSKNYTQRFLNTDIYQKIFENVLNQIIEHGLIDFTNINIDSTHLKASANKKKFVEKVIEKEKSIFEKEMLDYINEERSKDKDNPLPPSSGSGTKRTKESTTDSDAGWLNKGEKEKNFSYNAHTSCDKNGYILNTILKPSNIHDSQVFSEVYDSLIHNHKNEIVTIAIDAGYHSGPLIKHITDNGHLPLLPRKKAMGKKMYELYSTLTYDETNDVYVSPEGSFYRFISVNRQGYRIYRNESKRELRISIYQRYFDYVRELRLSDYGKEIYSQRKETIERCFADFKERHFGRYTHYRGLNKVRDHTLLSFASMNMKKMANFLAKVTISLSSIRSLLPIFNNKKHFFHQSLS